MARQKPLDDGGLFDRARARTTDPGTSHAAAQSVKPKLRDKQQLVLQCMKHRCEPAGVTDTDLVLAYQRWCSQSEFPPRQSESGIRTRRKELVDAGLVRDTGRRERLPSGRQAIVWEVVDADQA